MARYLVRGPLTININDSVEAEDPKTAIWLVASKVMKEASDAVQSDSRTDDMVVGLTAYDEHSDPDDPGTPIVSIPESEAQSEPD